MKSAIASLCILCVFSHADIAFALGADQSQEDGVKSKYLTFPTTRFCPTCQILNV